MIKTLPVFFIAACLLYTNPGLSQTLWMGPPIVFEKEAYADWSLPVNQDRITDSVWITRQDNQGIFNLRLEDAFDRENRTSPLGTEWANGRIADGIDNLTFTTWFLSKENSSAEEVGVNKVLHLIAEDIYLDLTFLAWTPGGGGSGTGFGGGFRYQRSTPGTTSRVGVSSVSPLSVTYQQHQLRIQSPMLIQQVRMLNSLGSVVYQETVQHPAMSHQLVMAPFPPGIYIIMVNEQLSVRLINR